MAAMDFPATPTVGQLYPATPVAGIPQYKWDGTAWVAVLATEMQNYVQRAGDIMTGSLTMAPPAMVTLSADPTAVMHAATKQYVDGGVGGVGGGLTAKVDKAGGAGGIMTGLLTLSADPAAALHAATKQYVDAGDVAGLAAAGMQINGGMEVDQANAGAAISIAAGSSDTPIIDGWRVSKSGTNAFTMQQVASTIPGYQKSLKLTCTTAQPSLGGDTVYIKQRIEGYRMSRLAWGTASAQPLTIGFWMKSAVTGLFFTIFQNFDVSLAAWPTINPVIATANVPQWVTLTWSPPTTGTWKYDNGIGAELCIIVGNSANMNIVGTVGNTLEITGLVVLPGARAYIAAQSPLLMRSYDQELATCQRYYEKMGYSMRFAATGALNYSSEIPFKVVKRTVPTVATFAGGTRNNLTSVSLGTPKAYSCRLDLSSTGAGDTYVLDEVGVADARL